MSWIIANVANNFLLSKLRSEFCLCQQLTARWLDLSHHWQTTEFLFHEKLILLFRHILSITGRKLH